MTNWIKSLTDQAQKENWCATPFCTTCGSEVFRSSLIKKCFQNNNLTFPDKIKASRRSKNFIIIDLFEDDLKLMNRAHNAQEAINCLTEATHYFKNISVDLIYGIPGLSNKQWNA